jgi:hypothetical protein
MSWLMFLTAALAGASPDCAEAPLTVSELTALVDEADRALDAGDIDAHRAVVDRLQARIDCLEVVPPTALWAELLVGLSLARYAEGNPLWRDPLANALRVQPDFDFGPLPEDHPIRMWTPPGQPPPGDPIPDGVAVYVDGQLQSRFVPAESLYDWTLVQIRGEAGPTNELVHNSQLPRAYVELMTDYEARQQARRRRRTRIRVGGTAAAVALAAGATAAFALADGEAARLSSPTTAAAAWETHRQRHNQLVVTGAGLATAALTGATLTWSLRW